MVDRARSWLGVDLAIPRIVMAGKKSKRPAAEVCHPVLEQAATRFMELERRLRSADAPGAGAKGARAGAEAFESEEPLCPSCWQTIKYHDRPRHYGSCARDAGDKSDLISLRLLAAARSSWGRAWPRADWIGSPCCATPWPFSRSLQHGSRTASPSRHRQDGMRPGGRMGGPGSVIVPSLRRPHGLDRRLLLRRSALLRSGWRGSRRSGCRAALHAEAPGGAVG